MGKTVWQLQLMLHNSVLRSLPSEPKEFSSDKHIKLSKLNFFFDFLAQLQVKLYYENLVSNHLQ